MADDIKTSMLLVRRFVGDNLTRSVFADACIDLLNEIERLRALIIEWDNAEQAADAVFSGPETVVADRRLSKAIDNLIKEARRG